MIAKNLTKEKKRLERRNQATKQHIAQTELQMKSLAMQIAEGKKSAVRLCWAHNPARFPALDADVGEALLATA